MNIQITASDAFLGRSVALYTSLNGKCYILPSWIEVPANTQLSDIEIIKDTSSQETDTQDFMIKGSSGKIYTVTYSKRYGYSCNCTGYKFHRNCKHIQQQMS